ncbi:3-dehydro-L-gulonate 2-dehydrogenase [Hymenobacter sp. 15J16-1T3B]|uniref:3-dehydro-L-gulonate 2-dehydrogenase n=1 Tax=Hymenobacter sp. 15J16-1T3B TaxID=2886941 RepID=UPI001D11E58B|nr:3-dehydro-L-gulonate 2-dehydrogenase [Hymenobacter sp. 15J16-1T3B]MCC3155633.1 3-dehydro-L-gulonate 2-dehydrogenase [Hymenobacter sp. 15J16-1T3B]
MSLRVPYPQVQHELKRVLLTLGFADAKAEHCATIFAQNSRDGVYTHGLNRFPAFVEAVRQGRVDPTAEPECVERTGGLERWDGHLAPGVYSAWQCMARAVELAKEHGVGCVALGNTNHWMRGGTYGWQAADAGCIGICFTNTIANVTPWGGREARLGNNPLVVAVPRGPEPPVVLDMALSQYSYGKLSTHAAQGDTLLVPGGYDQQGQLTTDPQAILASQRGLPIGFWKGSGLALVLDVLLVALTGGRSTAAISRSGEEYGITQCFIALHRPDMHAALIDDIIRYTKEGHEDQVRYPGEQSWATRQENLRLGIPVREDIWERVRGM